jgi:serine/threonine protein kinase
MQQRTLLTSEDDSAAVDRRAAARKVAERLLREWDRGIDVDEPDLFDCHPGLMPELVEEIRSVRSIRLAYLSTRHAVVSQEPVAVLTSDELDTPIVWGGDVESAPAELAPLKIAGYLLDRQLSQGGQAAVYTATQESTGRKVAVKVFHGAADATSAHRARFAREVEVLASLNHSNIVRVIDRGRSTNGSFFFVMDFVEGPHLDEHLASLNVESVTDARVIVGLFIKLCRGIESAHREGVVHRDLKPSNIRVDVHGEPKVFDFGLARQLMEISSGTVSGQLVGSIPWASPEQAAGSDAVGPASDIYSLGVMLYQALAGRFPYEVDGPLHVVLANIAAAIPMSPSSVRRHAFSRARRLDAIVLKSLSKLPGARYGSAGALADDLERLLAGRKTIAQPPRKRWWHRLAAFGLVVAALFFLMPRVLKPPVVIHLVSIENSIGMRMVRVPANIDLVDDGAAVNGQHLTMKSFLIATTEVTQAQYAAIMNENPSPPLERRPDLPVSNVTFKDARTFCEKLTAREHRQYRLPTRYEWAYACRAGDPESLAPPTLDHMAWHSANSGGKPHPVGQNWPNSWGLYDMRGGMAEWCDATRHTALRTIGEATTRQRDDTHRLQAAIGGSFLTGREFCSTVYPIRYSPESGARDIGFRVVCDLE